MNNPMRCEDFEGILNARLDGELDEQTCAQMDEHAKTCEACAKKLQAASQIRDMLSKLDDGLEIPLSAQAAWRRAVRAQAQKRKKSGRTGALRAVGLIAAAFAVLIGCTAAFRTRGTLPLSGAVGQTVDSGAFVSGNIVQRSVPSNIVEDSVYDAEETYAAQDAAVDANVSGKAGMRLASDGAVESGVQAASAAGEIKQEQGVIVIRSAQRSLETTGFDQSYQMLEDLVGEHGGFFEQSSVTGDPIEAGKTRGRTAKMTARIPGDSLDAFLDSIAVVGTTTYRSESAEDISSQYYDRAGRLASCQAQLDRLNELTGSAAGLEDLLLLEERTADVEYEIEQLQGQLKSWMSRANYSTVSITLTEVAARDQVQPTVTSLGDRVREGFYDSLNWLNDFWQDAAVTLAMLAPMLVLIIPLAVVIWVIVAAVRRRRRDRGKE